MRRTDAAGPIRNMHDVFSNRHRRAILYYLQHEDDPTAIADVERELVDAAPGTAPAQSEGGSADGLSSRLLRVHIQELEAFGILKHDADGVRISEDVTITVSSP